MAHFNQHLQALDTILYQIRYRDPQRIRGEVADLFMKPHVASLTPQSRPLGIYSAYYYIFPLSLAHYTAIHILYVAYLCCKLTFLLSLIKLLFTHIILKLIHIIFMTQTRKRYLSSTFLHVVSWVFRSSYIISCLNFLSIKR